MSPTVDSSLDLFESCPATPIITEEDERSSDSKIPATATESENPIMDPDIPDAPLLDSVEPIIANATSMPSIPLEDVGKSSLEEEEELYVPVSTTISPPTPDTATSAEDPDPLSKSIKMNTPKRDSILFNSPFSCSWEGLCDTADLLLYKPEIHDKLMNNNINTNNNENEEIDHFHYFIGNNNNLKNLGLERNNNNATYSLV